MDRNCPPGPPSFLSGASLSARRAWIEIVPLANGGALSSVALRKESVDRNILADTMLHAQNRSLSARRAWIEIAYPKKIGRLLVGRSPQGERG